ncbi:hypothetical protein PM082_008933 [Marasmius tenuissimus]|nr:hypothetical protein PM082_008933 [Marasmius tenuissimus]
MIIKAANANTKSTETRLLDVYRLVLVQRCDSPRSSQSGIYHRSLRQTRSGSNTTACTDSPSLSSMHPHTTAAPIFATPVGALYTFHVHIFDESPISALSWRGLISGWLRVGVYVEDDDLFRNDRDLKVNGNGEETPGVFTLLIREEEVPFSVEVVRVKKYPFSRRR